MRNKHIFGDPCENRTPRLQLERLVSYTNLTKGPYKSSTRIALGTRQRSGFYEPPDIFYERSVLMYAGAADGNRTRMMFPPWDFRTAYTYLFVYHHILLWLAVWNKSLPCQ